MILQPLRGCLNTASCLARAGGHNSGSKTAALAAVICMWFTYVVNKMVSRHRMAARNAEQVLHLLMASSIEELDSGEETDIKEDPAFPLPQPDYSNESDSSNEDS